MTRAEFKALCSKEILFLDGATGSNLQKAGMPTGVCPEEWILEHPQVMVKLQQDYIEAGSHILYAPTFTANRIKLKEYGLEGRIREMNTALVRLSKGAAGNKALIAGNLTMTGAQLYPMGQLPFEELVEVYKEQASYLIMAGVDLFVVETMMSLNEARAALLAIRQCCLLPVLVTMTFNPDGRTFYGTDPETAMVVLQSLGADAVGINCSTGPEQMLSLLKEMKAVANVPIIAKPNAGMPQLIDGETVYDMIPEDFASYGRALIEAGASMLGGCCGTTPEHIRQLKAAVADCVPQPVNPYRQGILASERRCLKIDPNGPFLVIGERINPTGKKKLQAELREGNLDLVTEMAESQELNGAAILDINMGMNGVDEKTLMLEAIYQVTQAVSLPLCIDSSHVDVIEAALQIYPGRALINSISLEKEKFERLLPIAAKYGAMFIILPLSDQGLPKDLEDKKRIIRTIMDKALELGCQKSDMIVDGLVATVGANKNAALETLETIRYCKEELGLCTVCGLSNISFGLPERGYVNTAFLTMAISQGLTMAIANPSQDLLMNAAYATDLLMNKPVGDIRYINRMNSRKNQSQGQNGSESTTIAAAQTPEEKVYEAVIKGNKKNILSLVDIVLSQGNSPEDIINNHLIPAINQVGTLFDQQIYFLPQLIASAEAMKTAIDYLEPKIDKTKAGAKERATIVMATVEGDIHDIGKNLVVLMLKNYGYRVIDLGKDVNKTVIVDTAIKEGAAIIGLSALMTTTMMRMKDVVEEVKARQCKARVIIGGAVITQSFADEIGAQGYSKDAAEAVRLVERLLSIE